MLEVCTVTLNIASDATEPRSRQQDSMLMAFVESWIALNFLETW